MTKQQQNERKAEQRKRQRAWLKKYTPVLTAEALVSLLMKLDPTGEKIAEVMK